MFDILFLASNRLEFTKASFKALQDSLRGRTDIRICAYVDCDEEGTFEYLRPLLGPTDEIHRTHLGGPVAVTNHFLNERSPSDIFAKIDNDLILCHGWFETCLHLLDQHPEVELLGIEPRSTDPVWTGHGIDLAGHIGGIGVFRRAAFDRNPRPVANGRFGFTGWQYSYKDVVRAWVSPPLHVFLLDHLAFEPWASLSATYREKGWQRQPWGDYPAGYESLWKWWAPWEVPPISHVEPITDTQPEN